MLLFSLLLSKYYAMIEFIMFIILSIAYEGELGSLSCNIYHEPNVLDTKLLNSLKYIIVLFKLIQHSGVLVPTVVFAILIKSDGFFTSASSIF